MRSMSRVVPALVLIGALASAGCSTSDTAAPAPSTTAAPAPSGAPGSTGSTSPASTPVGGGANVVTVKTFQFKPTPLTVAAGTPVVWQNQDEITHEPTSGAPGQPTTAFAAVTLDGAGSSGSVTIAAPGTYPYFCAVHESMRGEIVVT